MKTEDAGDYGGSCDTCAQGQAVPGYGSCVACVRQQLQEDMRAEIALDKLHDEINDDIENDTTGGRWK